MNLGALESSSVQQIMAGSPNCWNFTGMRTPTTQPSTPFLPPNTNFVPTSSSSSLPFPFWFDGQELPASCSQLLHMEGLVEEGDKSDGMSQFEGKGLLYWEEQENTDQALFEEVKKEKPACSYNVYGDRIEDFQAAAIIPFWSQMIPSSLSPKSCLTSSFSTNMLDFSNRKDRRHPAPDRSSQCNSNGSANCGGVKKARMIQTSTSTQTTFKVRKEKLGDRITVLHQLVSPFGKTDTASVLSEAIGYIRFLQSQIEALSLPYFGTGSGNTRQLHPNSVQGGRNCIFTEDPGQDVNDDEEAKDLRSRGLCLVPVSCTLQVGNENGADYWAPAAIGGGGF